MATCIYITLTLLFSSPFYTSSILLGRLADPDTPRQTHSPQQACPSGIPQTCALLAPLPAGIPLLGHSHLVLSSRKLSTVGLNGCVALPLPCWYSHLRLCWGVFVSTPLLWQPGCWSHPPQPGATSRPQRVKTPMICNPGIPSSFVVSPSGSVAIIVQLAGSSSQIFFSSIFFFSSSSLSIPSSISFDVKSSSICLLRMVFSSSINSILLALVHFPHFRLLFLDPHCHVFLQPLYPLIN